MQGRGIGGRLIRVYDGRLGGGGELGYLETDRPQNVQFYKRWGFTVTGELEGRGVQTWLMRKRPAV